MGKANDDPRRKKIADRLKDAIETRGFKVDDFEQEQLKRGRGYVAEAIRGSKRLSVELILEVTTKLNADPQEVLAPHRGRGLRSEVAEGAEGEVSAAAAPLPASMRDASLVLQALLLTLDDNRLVSVGEVESRLRQLRQARS